MSLALICGTGDLPARLAASQPEAPLICVLDGFAPNRLEADVSFRLETLGSLLIQLGHAGITDVCFCGAIDRPGFDPAALDEHTAPLVPLIAQAMQSGDDAALRAVAGLFEQTGFRVRGAHEIAPDLVAPPGVLTEAWPDALMRKDAELGFGILNALAPFDVSQACIVGEGQLLGVETVAGTDALILGLAYSAHVGKGILVKGPKTGQDSRLDMPTVGPKTVAAVRKAGLRGIVVDAGDVIMLEQEAVIEACDAAGLVFWSRTGE